ncbi:ABC transporter related [Thermosinus carboxydivorans Nor1]|uniref:ABC transporter related n=2 Tax=Thermosinus TaxID=261684 RepID=A1HNQ2_9FIRM|nr:ABC transporter related [Thermosinus carboxydivorans Nor1]
MPLLRVENLTVCYRNKNEATLALHDFSCQVNAGEAVGIIGQSGAGKTTLALALLNLLGDRAVIESGSVFFRGRNLFKLSPHDWQSIRGKEIALIPQASQNAWNPVLTIGHQMAEHIENQLGIARSEAVRRAAAALHEVGLTETVLSSYPHQLSGGMRQRVAIATACVTEPACIIADECTNSLDAAHQNDVLQLLDNLSQTRKMAIIIISHDLTVIARLCRRIYVLYQGKLVETGPTEAILRFPTHPYTQKIIADTQYLCASLLAV